MRTRMVKTQDVELYVVEDGDPKKPGILFLHGFPDCHRVWENQFRALARDFHVIAFDLRGCGHSSASTKSDAYHIPNVLPDILAVIDATRGKEGNVHLVAHDWGSVLGWSFVADPVYAARVQSWTSMSGPHVGLMWQWLYRKVTSGRLADLKLAAEQFTHSWYVFALNIPGLGRALFRFAGVEVWRRGLQQGGVPAGDPYLHIGQDEVERITLNTIGLYQQNAFNPPPVPAAHSITTPTQLLMPMDDAFIRPGLFEYLDEVCTDITRVTLDANHWAQRSNPEEVTTLIRGFISRIARDQAPAVKKKSPPVKTEKATAKSSAAKSSTAKSLAAKASATRTPAAKTTPVTKSSARKRKA